MMNKKHFLEAMQQQGFLAWLGSEEYLSIAPQQLFSPQLYDALGGELSEYCNSKGYVLDQRYWKCLRKYLQGFAEIQKKYIDGQSSSADPFNNYAAFYDVINGQTNLQYIAKCLHFFIATYDSNFAKRSILSAGCGTGIVESYMIDKLGVNKASLFGFDLSAAMVRLAKQRIHAEVDDLTTFQTASESWDFCCAWTNVLQYLPSQSLETAISNLANALKPGGYFVGDFITPDHIRCFPHVLQSEKVSLLRQPTLWYEGQQLFQVTELFNVSQLNDQFTVTYEGKHKRFLPSLAKMRSLFSRYFGSITLYDALSLEQLRLDADTTASTRYLLIAKK